MSSAEALVLEMGAALVERDTAALDRLWSEDCHFTTPTGVVLTKAERLEAITTHRRPIRSLEFDDLTTREYPSSAIVTARYAETAVDGTMGERGRVTVVLVRFEIGWRIVGMHQGPITRPFR